MDIKVSKNRDDIYLIELSGILDLCSSNQLKELIMKMIKEKSDRFIISLKDVDNINSAGIGALINIFSTLKKLNCTLVIIAPEGPVLQALEATRIKDLFTIAKTLKEAVALGSKTVN